MERKKITKRCIACDRTLDATPENFFYRNKKRGWLSSWCKQCRKIRRNAYTARELELQKKRRGSTLCRVCGSKEKPKGTRYCRICFVKLKREKKHKDKCIYRSRLRKATPKWADKSAIREFYKNVPAGYQVDHIIPIRHRFVCGLHLITNLQYLTAKENLSKSNRFSDGNHYSYGFNGRK
jgi:hypothetical protein